MLMQFKKNILKRMATGRSRISRTWTYQKMHEDPEMPNYGKRGRGKLFIEGMVVAIEPMINMGTKHQTTERWLDNLTADGKPSAHFEHDVAY
jgi:methionyl aminopeptidase